MKKLVCLFLTLLSLLLTACAEEESFSNDYTAVDPSAAVGGSAVADYGYDLPEGFTAADGITGMYESPDYPDDASNFYVARGDADPYFSDYDTAILEAALSLSLTQQMGVDVAVTVDALEYFTVDTLPAYRMELHYTVSGLALRQLVVCVNADHNYTFTWTQVGDADWMDAFRASADSLWFKLQ